MLMVFQVQQPLERMQFFLSMMHDNCYHILGNAGVSLGLQFYQHPHLTDYLVHSSLANLHLVPDYRLRPIIRTFLKPFIQWCPPQCYQTVLLPILNHLCPFSECCVIISFCENHFVLLFMSYIFLPIDDCDIVLQPIIPYLFSLAMSA